MMKSELKLIDSTTVFLAGIVGLIKEVRPVRLQSRAESWGLLVKGRGIARLLRADVLPASPDLLRPVGWNTPRPEKFASERAARRYAEHMGWGGRNRFGIYPASE